MAGTAKRGWTVSGRGCAVAVLALAVLLAAFGPWLAPYSVTQVDLHHVRAGMSRQHWLGTDQLGRDELSRLVSASRTSLVTVALVLLISLPVGLLLGLVAGWCGGVVDSVVLRCTDVVVAVPGLLIGLVLASALGAGTASVVIALSAATWAPYARLVRTEIRILRHQPLADGLLLLGVARWRILLLHLLPLVVRPVLVLTSTEIAATILGISTLTFLGLGVRPPAPEWGSMIVESRPYLATDPRLFLVPLLAIGVVVLAVNATAEQKRRPRPAPRGHPVRAPEVLPTHARAASVPAEPALRVRGLTVELSGPHGRHRVVDDLDFELERGRVLALVGPSGSGKSMTLAALLGLVPDAVAATVTGTVRLSGRCISALSERDMRAVRGARIGLVLQDPTTALNPMRRVESQVAEVLRLHRALSPTQTRRRVRELLTYVGFADADRVARLRPGQLSGGMRQRVLIAAVLAGEPDVILADEPTSALDAATASGILALLATLVEDTGAALVIVTHDFGVVTALADDVVVLDAGREVESGPVQQILQRPAHPLTRALVAASTVLSDVASPCVPHPRPSAPARPDVLIARGVAVDYREGMSGRRHRALTDVSMRVGAGECVGLVGASGSGKSTVARAVAGLQPLSSGSVSVHGRATDPRNRRTQLVFQETAHALDQRQTVGAALAEILAVRGMRGARSQDEITRLLAMVELDRDLADRKAWQLSGGQRQRVGIARALAARPDLLILDEPVSSLDTIVAAEILTLLQSLKCSGTAMILISHDLSVVARIADHLVVMDGGHVVEQGPTSTVLSDPVAAATRAMVQARAPSFAAPAGQRVTTRAQHSRTPVTGHPSTILRRTRSNR